MSYIFLFPGQGSQKIGMGKDFYDKFERAKERFVHANEILNKDISKIIFEGPEESLKSTENTQPALFIIETLICDILKEKDIHPLYALGHSIGEYAALYSSNLFSFEDGLRIVAKRGELMANAGKLSKGAMAAIMGLSKETISSVLATITEGTASSANENSPEQTVISGDENAIEKACEKLKEAGAKKIVKLKVSGAFHSALMKPAAEEFENYLLSYTFKTPIHPIVSNVTAKPENDPQLLKNLLIKQLLSPVRWVDSMKFVSQLENVTCIEVGSGNILKGLARRCSRDIKVISCNSVDNLFSLIN